MTIKHNILNIIIIHYLDISQIIVHLLYICTIFTILIKVATTDFLEQLSLHTRNLCIVPFQAASVNLLACVMINFELSNMADSQAYGDNYKQSLLFFIFFFYKKQAYKKGNGWQIKNLINQLVCLRDFDNI